MDPTLQFLAQLGPTGLLLLALALNAAGIAALWLVLRHLPRREAQHEAHVGRLVDVFRKELALHRKAMTSLTTAVELALPCRPLRPYPEPEPEPTEAA